MAVTIDEMHVEVQPTPPSTQAAAPADDSKKDIHLVDALHLLHERKARLKAD